MKEKKEEGKKKGIWSGSIPSLTVNGMPRT